LEWGWNQDLNITAPKTGNKMASPRIISITWGKMEIEGVGVERDFKLWPGGGCPWDWSETGTHHSPGIQVADMDELITNGSEALVFGRGMDLRLGLSQEAVDHLKSLHLEYYFEETNAAVKQYNRLVEEGRAVGGLFHSTC
jgi:hypothetical protein